MNSICLSWSYKTKPRETTVLSRDMTWNVSMKRKQAIKRPLNPKIHFPVIRTAQRETRLREPLDRVVYLH